MSSYMVAKLRPSLISNCSPPSSAPASWPVYLLSWSPTVTKKDKKMEQGQIKFVLMKGIGNSFIDRSVSDEELLEGIREILK